MHLRWNKAPILAHVVLATLLTPQSALSFAGKKRQTDTNTYSSYFAGESNAHLQQLDDVIDARGHLVEDNIFYIILVILSSQSLHFVQWPGILYNCSAQQRRTVCLPRIVRASSIYHGQRA